MSGEKLAEAVRELNDAGSDNVHQTRKEATSPLDTTGPITNDEVRQMFESAVPEVKEWLMTYRNMKTSAKKDAYALFLNLTAIGDLS